MHLFFMENGQERLSLHTTIYSISHDMKNQAEELWAFIAHVIIYVLTANCTRAYAQVSHNNILELEVTMFSAVQSPPIIFHTRKAVAKNRAVAKAREEVARKVSI